MQSTPLTFRVSPNSVITPTGLLVNGGLQPLRHREDFLAVAFASGAAVSDVLAALFPDATAIPLADGTVQPSTEESWSHYSRNLISLKASDLDSRQFGEYGKTLLQWCVAAEATARMLSHPILGTAEFLPVEYLAHNGGASLACSVEDWAAHLVWLKYSNSRQGFQDSMEGETRRDFRPPALTVLSPWPCALGAKLGEGATGDAQVLGYAGDILSDQSAYWIRTGTGRITVQLQVPLREQFDALAGDRTDPVIQLPMTVAVGGKEFFIRASRERRASGKSYYCFRVLRTTMPCLDALWK